MSIEAANNKLEIKEALMAIDKRNKKGRGIIGGFFLFLAFIKLTNGIATNITSSKNSILNWFLNAGSS